MEMVGWLVGYSVILKGSNWAHPQIYAFHITQ